MNGFLRPEVARWLSRWAESMAAGGLALLGAYALWRGIHRYNLILDLIGLVLLLIGAAVFWASFQRTRFARTTKGPGLVEVTERQISYLTPEGGGAIELDELTRLELRSTISDGRSWVLKQRAGLTLFIPVEATGAERLFDAFAALPGIDGARLVAAVNATGDQRDVIWRAEQRFTALT